MALDGSCPTPRLTYIHYKGADRLGNRVPSGRSYETLGLQEVICRIDGFAIRCPADDVWQVISGATHGSYGNWQLPRPPSQIRLLFYSLAAVCFAAAAARRQRRS
jgi:hypothetical protein